ncbi:MAG: phosphopantetheine-binding protein [Cyclobacteriaceae bacterium]|jgi:acyl carrier protein|nr:phosphopantetheine-binding protein [Cyclobacteriaceae bacterium]
MNLSETVEIIFEKLIQFDDSLRNTPIHENQNLLESGYLDSIKFIDFVVFLQSVFAVDIDFELIDLSNNSTVLGLAKLFHESSLSHDFS